MRRRSRRSPKRRSTRRQRNASSSSTTAHEQSDALARIEARLRPCSRCRRASKPMQGSIHGLRAQGLENLPRLFRKLSVEPDAKPRSRPCCASALKVSKSAGSIRSPPWRRMRRPHAWRFSRPSAPLPASGAGASIPGSSRLSDRVRGALRCGACGGACGLARECLRRGRSCDGTGSTRPVLPSGRAVCRAKAAHRVSRHGVRFYAADDQAAGCSRGGWKSTTSSARCARSV